MNGFFYNTNGYFITIVQFHFPRCSFTFLIQRLPYNRTDAPFQYDRIMITYTYTYAVKEADIYTVTVSGDGHGSAKADPASGVTGAKVTHIPSLPFSSG